MMKEYLKQFSLRSLGLALATAFSGTAIGAVAGNWLFGTLVGIGSAFAVVLTTIGVSLAWKGGLEIDDIQNAYRAAVAKSDSEGIRDALEITEDGDFDFDDISKYQDKDDELYDDDTSAR